MEQAKPHEIPWEAMEEAYERVKRNGGSCGVDGESIGEFEKKSEDNLYKIWNRMSSGSYFPPAVRTVVIPKADGRGVRKLGIPTVGDRVAQMVAVMYLSPQMERKFHSDSYGYRTGKSARDAIGMVRQRCWKSDWVIDLDIKAFFDNLDHELLMKAVQLHTDCKWLLLYISRWLKAPVIEDGKKEVTREKGTPQGGVISPLLANVYLHHAFDEWMREKHPYVPFARYADDIVVNCKSLAQAKYMLRQIKVRLLEWKLELHPEKTRIVYCKDDRRGGAHTNVSFEFLGYEFQVRQSRNKLGQRYGRFLPAISKKAGKRISQTMSSWGIQRRTDLDLNQIAAFCNPKLRGWMNYYGTYSQHVLGSKLRVLNLHLVKWARRKYGRTTGEAWRYLRRTRLRTPELFAHWRLCWHVAE